MRHKSLEHRFVRTVPRDIEPGVLYVSMDYATAVHSCCCGCGERIVTPFTPTDWKMTFDGETISLHPSVGNWQLRCRSHYVVHEGRVLEAGNWTAAEVAAGLRREQAAKRRYYQQQGSSRPEAEVQSPGLLSVDAPRADQEATERQQARGSGGVWGMLSRGVNFLLGRTR
jgi:hypothetical protein